MSKNETPIGKREQHSNQKSHPSIAINDSQPLIPSSLPLSKLDELDLNDIIVEIKNLRFSYDNIKGDLLTDINMTFPRSAIYGFVGPSGCGKTTLTKLIVGRLSPTSGSIKVNGRQLFDPKNKIPGVGIGYMPQEYAVYGQFTILETLNYYSKIYGLSSDYKKKRIEFLIKLLELPEPYSLVHVLSSGQKRRVSLAVAIVHNPPLLILDEPTTGVDPVLRDRIWEYLVKLSNEEKTSILITTHYMEECRRAHVIALMRGGKILAENSPINLLKHFSTDDLNDVFLQMCRFQERQDSIPMPLNIAQIRASKAKASYELKKTIRNEWSSSTQTTRFMALTHKNLIRLLRQKLLLFTITLLPALTMILFCIAIGKKPFDLDIAVYNEEIENNKITNKLSLKFLNLIDTKTLVLKSYSSYISAMDSIRNGITYGILRINHNFTLALKERIEAKNFVVSDEVLRQSTIQFFVDLSNIMIFQTMFQTLIASESQFRIQLLLENSVNKSGHQKPNPRAALSLLEFVNPPVYGTLSPVFRDFATPGLLICVIYVLSMAVMALNMVSERKEGLLDRTLVAGVGIHEILWAEIVIQHIVLFLQIFLLLVVIFPIFNIKNEGSIALIVLITLFQGVCGMAFGLFISAICRDETSALLLCVGCFVPYLVLSGIIWPLEGMHYILRALALFSPQTLPVITLRNIMLKGWTIGRTFVWTGFGSSIFWFIAFLILTLIFSSIRND